MRPRYGASGWAGHLAATPRPSPCRRSKRGVGSPAPALPRVQRAVHALLKSEDCKSEVQRGVRKCSAQDGSLSVKCTQTRNRLHTAA